MDVPLLRQCRNPFVMNDCSKRLVLGFPILTLILQVINAVASLSFAA
jgi:hypothetical protein